MSEILHMPHSHQMFDSDQKTELSGNRKRSEGLKEAVAAFCQVWIDFLVKILTISTDVSIGIESKICKQPLLSLLG